MSCGTELHFDAVLEALMCSIDDSIWRGRLRQIACDHHRTLHIAVMHEPYLSQLLSGIKTIESRFSINRIRPYGRVEPGDVLALKRQSGPLIGLALISGARFYELDSGVLESLREQFGTELAATDDLFWQERSHASYATLMDVIHPLRIREVPVRKRDRRGWVSLMPHNPSRKAA